MRKGTSEPGSRSAASRRFSRNSTGCTFQRRDSAAHRLSASAAGSCVRSAAGSWRLQSRSPGFGGRNARLAERCGFSIPARCMTGRASARSSPRAPASGDGASRKIGRRIDQTGQQIVVVTAARSGFAPGVNTMRPSSHRAHHPTNLPDLARQDTYYSEGMH